MAEHTIKAFDEEIDRLRGLIAEMGGRAEAAIESAMTALQRQDLAQWGSHRSRCGREGHRPRQLFTIVAVCWNGGGKLRRLDPGTPLWAFQELKL